LIARLSVVAVVCAIAIGFLMFCIHKLNKHLKQLENQEVPHLSFLRSLAVLRSLSHQSWALKLHSRLNKRFCCFEY
jgi:hypothetical protein